MNRSLDLFIDSPTAITSLDWPNDYEQQFWQEYPLKIAKGAAMRAIAKARKKGVAWQMIIDGVRRYKIWLRSPGWRPAPKHPATWINAECWNDELPMYEAQRGNGGNAFARMAARSAMGGDDDR